MTAMFIWRDESGAPCIIVKNALDHKGCDNLIKQLKGDTTPGTHIEDDGSLSKGPNNKETQMFHGLTILIYTTQLKVMLMLLITSVVGDMIL